MDRSDLPSLEDVRAAAVRIAPLLPRTPLHRLVGLTEEVHARSVSLKLETLQPTGSFKVRGAANLLVSLTPEERKKGVITFSTGNHGLAVAYVARQLGVQAVVCLSRHVAAYRMEAVKRLGAELAVCGHSQDEAQEHYEQLRKDAGFLPVVPFDDPMIIAGQGTIAWEIFHQAPEVDTILVPLSGGGLLAGMASAIKALKPSVRVIGVSVRCSTVMLDSLRAGRPVTIDEQDTLADSLLGGIGSKNRFTMDMVSRYVDEHVVVDEPEILESMYYLLSHEGLVAEGAAVVTLAAMRSGAVKTEGRSIVVPLTGRNVDVRAYLTLMAEKEREKYETE
ncbi:MAG: pyridoxal-phosphate dependent enzyme [Spirochaetota bacterium]